MKVFFDCNMTTLRPRGCSTVRGMLVMAKAVLDASEDNFCYFTIPDNLPEEYMVDYPDHPRMKYIPIEIRFSDRIYDYRNIPPKLAAALRFETGIWDIDALVTFRAPLVPHMQVLMSSPRANYAKRPAFQIYIWEAMMMSSIKATVPTPNPQTQDLQLALSYLIAEATYIGAYHLKKKFMRVVKAHLSFNSLKELDRKLHEKTGIYISAYDSKLKDEFKYDGSKPMTVAYVGRLEKSSGRLEDINTILRTQYITNSEKVRPITCTVSEGSRLLDEDAIDVMHPDRDEFWRVCREEMDLAVSLVREQEAGGAILEPLLFGVPFLIPKVAWAIGAVGEDYPFYASTVSEQVALISRFADNYDREYAKFAKWWEETFIPMWTEREVNGRPSHLVESLTAFKEGQQGMGNGGLNNEVVKCLVEEDWSYPRDLREVIIAGGEERYGGLVTKLKPSNRTIQLTFVNELNYYRLALIKHYGFQDAGADLGMLINPKEAKA